ncbi:MAG TPA: DoxX family protein [Lacipirellulaceae bacterium]|nr:DoxX family protein [Lacipirellulaceae bacterium]
MLRIAVALLFIATGTTHFANPDPLVRIVPPFIPWPLGLVWISGFLEIAGGLGLLVPALRRWAGIGLIALLFAVYPANIYMATNDVPFGDAHVPWWGHAIRLPLQFVLIALVFWVADLRRPNTKADSPK